MLLSLDQQRAAEVSESQGGAAAVVNQAIAKMDVKMLHPACIRTRAEARTRLASEQEQLRPATEQQVDCLHFSQPHEQSDKRCKQVSASRISLPITHDLVLADPTLAKRARYD